MTSGVTVTTNYDNNMLPTDVSGTSNYVPSMTYDSAGRLLTRALGNGLTQTYNYYAWNQQGGRLHTLVTGALQNLTYQYDSVGNITQIADSVAGETSVYDYDALDRLTNWTLNQNSPETYTYDAQGNLDVKNGLDLNYNDAAHTHAVTHIGAAQKYWYDENGNQVTRILGADTFNLIYDAENRLVEVKKNSVTIAQFTFDGDGARVKSVMGSDTILFVGNYFEQKGSQAMKYYFAGASRIAIRKYTIPQSMTVEYLLGDHLGSTSITTDTNGALVSEIRYKPWGETRYTSIDAPANTSPVYELVKYQYTGQYSYDVEFGLKYYGARFYDSAVGRFVSADSIIPQQTQGTQSWDRYAYTNNNPIRFTDPTGHFVNILIGAAIGAVVNVGLYAWNEAANQDGLSKSDWGDIAVAALQGAVVGGLIGSGVGAGAGVSLAMSAGLGAASSLVSTQVGNLITGEDYNAATSSIDAATGAVSGMLTAGTGSQAVKNVVAGGLDTANYAIDSLVTGEDITLAGLGGSFASGLIGQAWQTEGVARSLQPTYEDFGTGVFRMTSPGTSLQDAMIGTSLTIPALQALPESLISCIYDECWE